MYVIDRLCKLLTEGTNADVHFLVGEVGQKELLPAHKLILSSASDVFEAMFRFDAGNAKATKDLFAPGAEVISPVEVTDVEVGAFKTMLSFIYTDDLGELDGNNVIPVLYAAKKYNIPLLVKACVHFPIWRVADIFHTFAMANFLDEKAFAYRCLDYIEQNAKKLFTCASFLKIDQSLLCEILERDKLKVAEMKIWKAALRWADEQCRHNGIPCTAHNRRAMLGPALFKIRFLRIPRDKFLKKIVPCGVLSREEMGQVMLLHYQRFVPSLSQCPAQQQFQCTTDEHQLRRSSAQTSKGHLIMKIKQFAKFASDKKGGGGCDQLSHAVYARGLSWRILALSQAQEGADESLGFFLHCDGIQGVDWSCKCSASLRILSRSQNDQAENFTRKFVDQIFTPTSNNWGFNSFISYKELMDTRNGLYNNNDTVTLNIEFTVEDYHGEGGQQAMDESD